MRNIVKLVPILFLVSFFILEDLKAQRTSRRSQTDTTSVTTPSRTSTSGRRSTDDSGSSSARTGSSGRTTRNNDATSGRTTRAGSGRDAGAAKTSSDISSNAYGPYIFYSDLTDAHTVVSNACSWSKFQTPTSPYKLHKRARGYGSLNSSKTSCSGRTKKGRSQTKTSGFYILVEDNLTAAGYEISSGNVFTEIEAAASATVSGCMDSSADNYNSAATEDDGSCTYPAAVTVVSGCMDASADNYNSTATEDDGSCTYPVAVTVVSGCMDASADNYDSAATEDDGSCSFTFCDNPSASNYGQNASGVNIFSNFWQYRENWSGVHVSVVSEGCIYKGCMDNAADNYDYAATEDDGSCIYNGCTDSRATNYDASANQDDGSCVGIGGCTDSRATNYDATAQVDDGSCTLPSGCMNTAATNYDASATVDDGSCSFTFCDNPSASNYGQNASGVNIFSNFWQYRENWSGVHVSVVSEGCIYKGCMDNAADNYDYAATEDDGSCIYDD